MTVDWSFIGYTLRRTVLYHVPLVLAFGVAAFIVAVITTYTKGFMFVLGVTLIVTLKEVFYDPHPSWEYWVKSVWDILFFGFGMYFILQLFGILSLWAFIW